jgi:hypothetical protein
MSRNAVTRSSWYTISPGNSPRIILAKIVVIENLSLIIFQICPLDATGWYNKLNSDDLKPFREEL